MLPAFVLPSYAKINLMLRVLGKRDDGFHELLTIFQTVSLCDRMSFAEADELLLTCDDPAIPTGEANLVIRAAHGLRDLTGTSRGAHIHLEKRIPSPGGLGGGSSNAAVALVGLARLWKVEAPLDALYAIAAGVGSDVPFFLYGGTAIGTGRGESVEPIDDIRCENMLIVTPGVAVSTPDAYRDLDADSLTSQDANRILRVCRLEAGSLDLRQTALVNDLETVVFRRYPEVGLVKRTLLELGAVNAAMSGSGASVFAVFDNKEARHAAEKALDHRSTWRRCAVSTVSRSEYREALRC
jgi:4-diphosphocytidyl-2-C-methyl-D-erythritol kinase